MCEIRKRRYDFLARVNCVVVRIGVSSWNIIGVLSPVLLNVEINNTCCIVCPEDNVVLRKVIGWVEKVEWRPYTIEEPKLLRTFSTIEHPSTIGIGIAPI